MSLKVCCLECEQDIRDLTIRCQKAERLASALLAVAEAARQFVANAVIGPGHSPAVRCDYHELIASLATLDAQDCCGAMQPNHTSNCFDATGN